MTKIIAACALLITSPLFALQQPPRLIVQLVVDQLRGDLLHQYQADFGSKGFNYLLDNSLNYQNAHHPHANTVTCVGHATIATGAYPALHGIVANEWFDPQQGQMVYCMEDLNSDILATSPNNKPQPGRSPKNMLASTLSDELILAQKGRAFGVSFKDRSAIAMAGHAGKAFWFDRENGGFVTSRYYYQQYPQWAMSWNQGYKATSQTWTLSKPVEQYRYGKAPGFKNRFPAFGQHFPHKSGKPDAPEYYKLLSMTPVADELTANFAIQLLKEEQLGKTPGKTDYLAISFSAVDAIGHQFGPESLESEDNLLRLDKTISKLLAAIDHQAGLANTLIILTADHGVSDSPVYLSQHQLFENRPLTTETLQSAITDALAHRYQLPATTLQHIDLPYVYLNHEIINAHQLTINQVSTYLAEILRALPDVFQAYPLPLASTEHDWLSAKVDKMAYPGRAGDLYIVPPPYQALADNSDSRVTHGSPWNYDSYIPLLFVNPAFKAQGLSRPVYTTDIAPTLAAILLIKAPSAAVGQCLAEVTDFYGARP